jgi:hypothetical protein
MPKAAQAASFVYTAGRMDNFNTSDGPELSTPSNALKQSIDNYYYYGASLLFDRPLGDYNDFFVHTFSNLPNSIVSAQLEMRLRANDSLLTSNDRIDLSFTDSNGNKDLLYWAEYIGLNLERPDAAHLLSSWSGGDIHTFTFDLANFNLLTKLNEKGFLDVTVQDDTAVDYIKLTVETADSPKSVSEPSAALALLFFGTFGANFLRKCKRQ